MIKSGPRTKSNVPYIWTRKSFNGYPVIEVGHGIFVPKPTDYSLYALEQEIVKDLKYYGYEGTGSVDKVINFFWGDVEISPYHKLKNGDIIHMHITMKHRNTVSGGHKEADLTYMIPPNSFKYNPLTPGLHTSGLFPNAAELLATTNKGRAMMLVEKHTVKGDPGYHTAPLGNAHGIITAWYTASAIEGEGRYLDVLNMEELYISPGYPYGHLVMRVDGRDALQGSPNIAYPVGSAKESHAVLAHPVTIDGKVYPAGSTITFSDSGTAGSVQNGQYVNSLKNFKITKPPTSDKVVTTNYLYTKMNDGTYKWVNTKNPADVRDKETAPLSLTHYLAVDREILNYFTGTFRHSSLTEVPSGTAAEKEKYFMSLTNDVPDDAFRGQTGLNTIKMLEVETIGRDSFRDAHATLVELPKIQRIGENAFMYSRISVLNLPTVKIIGKGAFWSSHITWLNIESAETIGDGAFFFIRNDPSTIVTMKKKFDSHSERVRIFAPDGLADPMLGTNAITFHYV